MDWQLGKKKQQETESRNKWEFLKLVRYTTLDFRGAGVGG